MPSSLGSPGFSIGEAPMSLSGSLGGLRSPSPSPSPSSSSSSCLLLLLLRRLLLHLHLHLGFLRHVGSIVFGIGLGLGRVVVIVELDLRGGALGRHLRHLL